MPHAHLCRITGLSSLWEVWMHEYQSILYPNTHTHTNCQIKALGINPRLLSGKPVMWCLKSYICTFWNIAGIELIPGILYRSQSSHVCTLVTEGVPQQWPQDWKRSVFIPVPKKGNAKECSNHRTIGLILHASKVMLEILQARLQQYVNCELPDIQAGFRKGRGTRDQIAHWKNKRVPEKHLFLLYWPCQSFWLCGSQQTGKFWKRWEYQNTWPASWEICMQVRKQQLELDMEQQTGSK